MAKEALKPAADITTDSHDGVEDVEEQIRYRAYALYEQRGREDGNDLDDWLRAEAELI